MRSIRVAVCQIECHPALYTGGVAPLEEPFNPVNVSLSGLSMRGLQVNALQGICRREYLGWQQLRLESILKFLGDLEPAPDVVLFPEGSIPIEDLLLIGKWSASTGANVLAGSHTPLFTAQAKAIYRQIGLPNRRLTQLRETGNRQVLPLVRSGKVALIRKRLLSPFERSSIPESPQPILPIESVEIQLRSGSIQILPLICSEALQIPKIVGQPELIAIISYDAKPSQFTPFCTQQVNNRRTVAYCNDGRYGGSDILAIRDDRVSDWFRSAFPGGLPVGDAIIVADVDLDVTTVEVGTASPRSSIRWIRVSAVVAQSSAEGEVAQALETIRKLPEAAAKAAELRTILDSISATGLQQAKLKHLYHTESRGIPSEDLWTAIGSDVVIPNASGLRDLESNLADTSRNELMKLLSSRVAKNAIIAQELVEFLSRCQTIGVKRVYSIDTSPERPQFVVNRDAEAREICSFLDDRTMSVLEVTGLEQIGKSSVIDKALAQSGIRGVLHVPLSATSSPDYLLFALVKTLSEKPAPPYAKPVEVAKGDAIRQALSRLKVVIFHDSHFLLQGPTWRDPELLEVLKGIVTTAGACDVKIVFEGRQPIASELVSPNSRKPIRVQGLCGAKRDFGISLFDAQLRRVGLSPDATEQQQKIVVVERLGGHPVAIALAADIYFEEGLESLEKTIGERGGSVFRFIDKLVRALDLGEEARTILSLLSLARTALPRSALLGAVTFPAAPTLRDLILLGCVEVTQEGHIEIAGVVRGYFSSAELDPALSKKFHSAAARAFDDLAKQSRTNVAFAIEAEYHAGVAGIRVDSSTNLIDGALATARELYQRQEYEKAAEVLGPLLSRNRTKDTLRLAAQVAMRRNRLVEALDFAKEVFRRDPSDTDLLTQLARIALTQHQSDRVAKELVAIARRAGVEDVSILVVEGRLLLRDGELLLAEDVFTKARQRTERNPWPFYYLGLTYMRLGRMDDAITVLHEGQEFAYEVNTTRRAALNAIEVKLGLAYLFTDRVDLAAPIIENLVEVDPESPEVIQAYAALTIKRDGVAKAHEALARLSKAKIKGGPGRCQFHLIYGLFYLGIGDSSRAATEFSMAHAADRANVFVMMNGARTLYDLALARWTDGDDVYKTYVNQCAELVQRILEFDPDNSEGVSLMNALHQRFGKDLGQRPT